uniref:Ig-like domain-containing protein n=1 Tax=Salvator merianae TaxID=96440 RepID=A0A8D0BTD2_SALMN
MPKCKLGCVGGGWNEASSFSSGAPRGGDDLLWGGGRGDSFLLARRGGADLPPPSTCQEVSDLGSGLPKAVNGAVGAALSWVGAAQCPSPFLPPEHFLYQVRTECRFQNGTQRVQMLDRYFWGRQEYVRFDSQVGKFVALTELGRPDAEYWNREFLQSEKADVDRFCRHNYGIDWPFARDRRGEAGGGRVLTITPMDHPTTSQNILLICNVGRFFPPDIEIKWFKNGEEEEGSHVSSTDLIRNGDWTFQTEVMLETQLERGDVYTCQVDHASLKEPVTVQWDPQSDAARSKMWTGIVGCILFLVFVTPGVFLYVKNKKGDDGATWLGWLMN